MQAVWWLVWPKLFGSGARAIEGWTPSGHTRLLSASRLTVAPLHCMHSQQSGQQSATLLCIRALPVRATGCAYGCHLLRAVRIGRMGICVHATLWQQARIGMKPDVPSGRCVQLRLCPTRLPRGHRKITRSNTKTTSDLHKRRGPADHAIYDNTAKAHLGAESSSTRSSIAKRALQQAKALRRSDTTHFR